jgi:hypothetical protein
VRGPGLIGVSRMDTYGAEEGAAMGLSQYLAELGEGLAKGMELAKRVIANAPLTNFGVIQVLARIARADPGTGLLLQSLVVSIAAADDEAKMRLRAFIEKRAPKVLNQ